ncbi:MAG: S4 domain-containing protein YaaA [Fusobacteriaceae bacterium]
MEIITITSEFIKLDQFLKWVGVVSSGVDAKYFIQEGVVLVNNEIEIRRGKKLYNGDKVKFQEKEFEVKKIEM